MVRIVQINRKGKTPHKWLFIIHEEVGNTNLVYTINKIYLHGKWSFIKNELSSSWLSAVFLFYLFWHLWKIIWCDSKRYNDLFLSLYFSLKIVDRSNLCICYFKALVFQNGPQNTNACNYEIITILNHMFHWYQSQDNSETTKTSQLIWKLKLHVKQKKSPLVSLKKNFEELRISFSTASIRVK